MNEREERRKKKKERQRGDGTQEGEGGRNAAEIQGVEGRMRMWM